MLQHAWVCQCIRRNQPEKALRGKIRRMQQEILINWSPQETRVAVVKQGVVQEVHIERTLQRGLVGNI